MRNLTMNEILENKDFEEAKARYEACHSNRWKNQWWDIVCEIWKKTTKWAKLYVLDLVHRAVRRIAEVRHTISYTYWITLLNEKNERIYEKIGKADDPLSRWEKLLKHDYCARWGIVKYRINKVWERVDEPAEGLESYLRAMLIKAHPDDYVPNDRFSCDLTADEVLGYAADYIG